MTTVFHDCVSFDELAAHVPTWKGDCLHQKRMRSKSKEQKRVMLLVEMRNKDYMYKIVIN